MSLLVGTGIFIVVVLALVLSASDENARWQRAKSGPLRWRADCWITWGGTRVLRWTDAFSTEELAAYYAQREARRLAREIPSPEIGIHWGVRKARASEVGEHVLH